MLTVDRKAQLMAYCRIDVLEDGEDELLTLLYEAACGYMRDAGITAPAEGTARRARYDLCVNAMVLDAYDQRGTGIAGSVISDNPAYRRMISQLKHTEPVSNLDAGTGILGGA